MYPKVVLVVSRTHWKCLSCKELNAREVSIDQHLASIHGEFGKETSKHHFSVCCHSDGEVDTEFPHGRFVTNEIFSVARVKREKTKDTETSDIVLGQKSCRAEHKRKYESELPKGMNLRKEDIALNNDASENSSDTDFSPKEDNRDERKLIENEKQKQSSKQRPLRTLKRKVKPLQTKQIVKKGKRGRKSAAKVKSPLTNQAISECTRKTTTAAGTTKAPKKPVRNLGSKKGCTVSVLNFEKEELLSSNTQTLEPSTGSSTGHELCSNTDKPLSLNQGNSTFHAGKRQHVRRCKKPLDSDILPEINKLNIATSCVPWLLDKGRKAGEKVTRTIRRSLTPEEKQAVRELYGVPLLPEQQTTKLLVESPTRESTQICIEEKQHTHIGASSSSHLPLHSASGQQPSRDRGALLSYQDYMMNSGSAGTQGFFLDQYPTQQTLYAGYTSPHSWQQEQQFHSHHHSPEFYPAAMPQARSNMVNFQGDGNRGTGNTVKHYEDSNDYRAQNLSMNRPHSQGKPVSSNSIPDPGSHELYSTCTTKANMDSKTDLELKSQTLGMSDHKEIDLDSNPDNQCKVCGEKFLSASDYENHQRKVAAFDVTECKRCKCRFHGLHELNLHVFSLHETEKQGFCFICDHDTLGMEDLERHMHMHNFSHQHSPAALRFHDCRMCSEELPNLYTDIHVHYYQHHATHICSICYQTCRDLDAYKDHHSATHKGKAILCSICGSKFESVEDLSQHMPCAEDIWAEDGKGESCFKCGKWCPNRAVVEAHRKQHRSQEDVEAYREGAKAGFPCLSCEKVFKNKHACRRHIKMVHEGVSCYKHYCEYCGKGFLTKGHMRDHIALHHLKIKRYKCDYCDKQFVCGPTLRRHVRTEHTKHKPYQCPHCDERFFEKTPLQRHLTVHTGLAPFMCEHCGKGFYTKHSFRNHSSTHSTIKEFVCSGCRKGFTRKYNLLNHSKVCKML